MRTFVHECLFVCLSRVLQRPRQRRRRRQRRQRRQRPRQCRRPRRRRRRRHSAAARAARGVPSASFGHGCSCSCSCAQQARLGPALAPAVAADRVQKRLEVVAIEVRPAEDEALVHVVLVHDRFERVRFAKFRPLRASRGGVVLHVVERVDVVRHGARGYRIYIDALIVVDHHHRVVHRLRGRVFPFQINPRRILAQDVAAGRGSFDSKRRTSGWSSKASEAES